MFVLQISMSGWLTGRYNFHCQPVDYSNHPKTLRVSHIIGQKDRSSDYKWLSANKQFTVWFSLLFLWTYFILLSYIHKHFTLRPVTIDLWFAWGKNSWMLVIIVCWWYSPYHIDIFVITIFQMYSIINNADLYLCSKNIHINILYE